MDSLDALSNLAFINVKNTLKNSAAEISFESRAIIQKLPQRDFPKREAPTAGVKQTFLSLS